MIKLINLEVYKIALEIGDDVYHLVKSWNTFERDTLGKQFVRNSDSIALNISEGYGRYYYKENKVFCLYSRGSAYESTCCLRKAHSRKLITDHENAALRAKYGKYFGLMAGYLKSIGKVKPISEG